MNKEVMDDSGRIDMGPCCECGVESESVRNVITLPFRGPPGVQGGWGCFVCNLECIGATAILCDACIGAAVEHGKVPRYLMGGPTPMSKTRVATDSIEMIPHLHDDGAHDAHDAMHGRDIENPFDDDE